MSSTRAADADWTASVSRAARRRMEGVMSKQVRWTLPLSLALAVWGFFLAQGLFFLFERWLWDQEAITPG